MNPNAVVISAMKQPQNKNMFVSFWFWFAVVSDMLDYLFEKIVEADSANLNRMVSVRFADLPNALICLVREAAQR